MRESTHYELNLVEGTDKVNPLVQDVPNYETIDEAMFNNKCASIGIATELRTGTVHALVRQNEDAPMFRFTATSNYASGDTFTVDGVQVSALLVDGTPLPNMAYIIGSEVLCVLKGTLMTVFANRTTASDSDKLGGELPSHYATDSDLDALEGVVNVHTSQINQINSDLSVICKKPLWNKRTLADTTFTPTNDCYVSIFARGSTDAYTVVYINHTPMYSDYLKTVGSDAGSSTPYFYIPAGTQINYTTSAIDGGTVYESYFVITDCAS